MLNKKGFTLIELLVVIGLFAVIAAGVVALINPIEKTRQANDAKIFSDIGEITTALQSYAVTQTDGSYPCQTASGTCPNVTTPGQDGLNSLGPAGANELTRVPTQPAGAVYGYVSAPVATRPVTAVVVYGTLTSQKYIVKCPAATAYWMWNTTNGRACGFCGAAVPGVASVCTANF